MFIQLFQKKGRIVLLLLLLVVISCGSLLFLKSKEPVEMLASQRSGQMREISKGNIPTAIPVIGSFQVANPKTVRVILARVYLDGEVSEEILEETIMSMEDFWAEYSEWDLVDQDEAQVVFQQKIDDISPLLKFNGYFGISDEGRLNIYEGKPSDEKVIQSFYQINLRKLKSYQQKELEEGIPILSKERYEEVLKMYKKFAKHEM